MNLTKFIRVAGLPMALAAVMCFASCQKEAVTEVAPAPPVSTAALEATTMNSLATTTTSTRTYKTTAPIYLSNAHDLTINGDLITGGSVACINLVKCKNIHITNCKLINSTDVGVKLFGCTNITIDYSLITNVSTGVYAISCTQVQVRNNQMRNMMGPMPRGQFVQFNQVYGANNRIANNQFENIAGQSRTEDAINLWKCNGSPTDPIAVIANSIRGGGPSSSGGGINLGEQGGSYQTASYNTLVNPGQYGVGISGGTNIKLLNNLIYSESLPYSNVGIVYWNQSGLPCGGNTVSGNKVNFKSGRLGGAQNDNYIGPGNTAPTGWSSNTWRAPISSYILPSALITYN